MNSNSPFRPASPLDENIVNGIVFSDTYQRIIIGRITMYNTGGSPVFLHLFHGAASGKSIAAPNYVIPIRPDQIIDDPYDLAFEGGFSWALTATEGVADAPAATSTPCIGWRSS